MSFNQNPKQLVRDKVDQMLLASGWVVQSKNQINIATGRGVAIREYSSLSQADTTFTSFDKTVDKNFLFKKQAGTTRYTTKQVQWMQMIKDYIANSFHHDFSLGPFNKQSGLGKMWQLFGEGIDKIINKTK